MAILKLLETKNNAKYLGGYLGEDTRPLVLILLKMSGYVKTFKPFCRDDSVRYGRVFDPQRLSKYIEILSTKFSYF